MKHTSECLEFQAKREAERKAWKERWPNHCKACEGRGGAIHHGIRYRKDGTGEPDSFDICPTCEDVCPRCGAENPEHFLDEGMACAECGFNWGDKDDDFCPEPYDWPCDCEIAFLETGDA